VGLLLLAGCTPAPPPAKPAEVDIVTVPAPSASPAPKSEVPSATSPADGAGYAFDGIRIGSRFGREVMTRPPYDTPCDIDPLDHRTGQIVVYAAQPCRNRTFPEGTSIAFYLPAGSGGGEDLNVPIETIVWMGGGYFNTRSDFPLHTGEPVQRAEQMFGKPARTFRLADGERTLDVLAFPSGDLFAVAAGGTLVGFVVGKMPQDTENERWQGLLQLYYKLTLPKAAR
jgi:hypothetical protein